MNDLNENIIIGSYTLKRRDSSWKIDLIHFNIRNTKSVNNKLPLWLTKTSLSQKALIFLYVIEMRSKKSAKEISKVQLKWQDKLKKNGIYWMKNGLENVYKKSTTNTFLYGHFENPMLFNHIRDELLIEFTPLSPLLEKNKTLYEKIKDCESVCISIRRGDYVENPEYSSIFNICDQKYYEKAIKLIYDRIVNPQFVVFSDDVNWAKENLNLPVGTLFETGDDPVWEKLRLMYSCKHFIISNSTFSWWAQYLSRNIDKIVISPNIWKTDSTFSPLIEKSFLKIDVERKEFKTS